MIDFDFLQHYFGFSSLRSGQEEILTTLLAGEDALGILPTGTGKSLIYQYYGMYTKHKVVIISPLIALMQDQVHELQLLGEKRVVALTSMLTTREKNVIIQHLEQYQFIFLSPEMLQEERVLKKLKQQQIGLLVVDEAHCILQWGYDFRPEYLMIGKIKRELNHPLTLALTATATQQMISEIRESLLLAEDVFIYNNASIRQNNQIEIIQVEDAVKNDCLAELLYRVAYPCVLYGSSINGLEQLKIDLQYKFPQLKMDSYHSKRTKNDRQSIQQQFINNQLDILLATSAFGMGINKKDIKTIIHYHVPASLEDYVQQIGRAGRNGEQADVILLDSPADIAALKSRFMLEMNPKLLMSLYTSISENDFLSENQQTALDLANYYQYTEAEALLFFKKIFYDKLNKINTMQEYCQTQSCKVAMIQRYFGVNQTMASSGCQQCSICLHNSIMQRAKQEPQTISKAILETDNQDWQTKFKSLFKKI